MTVLEAESAPGYHASGRSVAFAHFGLGERIVRSLTAASLREFERTRGKSGDPITRIHPALHIARKCEMGALDDLAAVHERFGCRFDRLTGEQAAQAFPALSTGPDKVHAAILDQGSLKLDTDAMLQRHIAEIVASGGDIVAGARVTALEHSGDEWEVASTRGAFRCLRVVNAAGAWVDEVAKLAGCTPIEIEPRRRTVITLAGPPDTDVSRWPFVKTVGEGFYILPEGSGRLLASSMDQTPSAPCDAAADELDIAIAADRIVNATSLKIQRIEHSWAGLRSFARDELPLIGEADGAPGFFWYAGQGGFGFQTSPALSRVGEAAVLGLAFPADLAELDLAFSDFAPERLAA